MSDAASDQDARPEVVLMCGIAGSGKTTHAQRLATDGYVRLSIDEEIWTRFGRYGIDYDPNLYAEYTERVEECLRSRLLDLIAQGHCVVIDFSFWQRSSRDRYKRLIEDAGGCWRLIYLQVPPEILRRRLAERSQRFDANAAFPIDEHTLARYIHGFEVPRGEGEEVIVVTK